MYDYDCVIMTAKLTWPETETEIGYNELIKELNIIKLVLKMRA